MGTLLSLGRFFFFAFVIKMLWWWHVVPVFGAASLSYGHAVGLACLCDVVLMSLEGKFCKQIKAETETEKVERIVVVLICDVLTLAIGFVAA